MTTTRVSPCRVVSKGDGGDSWDRGVTGLSSDLGGGTGGVGEQQRVTRATSSMWLGAIHPGRVRRPFPVTGLELHFLLLAPSSLGFSSI